MKKITVAVLGAGEAELKDLEVESGTTASDILSALDLQGYQLLPDQGSAPFGQDESVYSQVEDGDKIFAVTGARVGS